MRKVKALIRGKWGPRGRGSRVSDGGLTGKNGQFELWSNYRVSMSTTPDSSPAKATGALLLCRAGHESVGLAAQLLRERMLLTGAGPEWSVLVPEGKPWLHGV